MKYISDFPSKQAEEFQKHLLELDTQGKLKEEFLSRYKSNMGTENSLANYIDKHWNEDGKKLFVEYTGIETFDDKQAIKRVGVKLNDVTYGSKRSILWKCNKCQYEWVARPNDRTSKHEQGCPYCSNYTFIRGKNDLETYCNKHTQFKRILEEFMQEDEKGNIISANSIARNSGLKVKWQCSKCKYTWYAKVYNRVYNNTGCPACEGHVCIPGINDLETYCTKQHQELAYILKEFTGILEDKRKVLYSQIARASSQRLYWKCNKCHKIWITTPKMRTLGHGCPYCSTSGTSFPEQYMFNCLKQVFPNVLNRAKTKDTHYEYDIVIPELILCIEYSGYSWHKDKIDRDKIKEAYCKSKGINFMQIYAHTGGLIEPDTYTKEKIIYEIDRNKSNHIKQLQQIIKFILKEYNSEALYNSIDFELAEQQANKVMGKA